MEKESSEMALQRQKVLAIKAMHLAMRVLLNN